MSLYQHLGNIQRIVDAFGPPAMWEVLAANARIAEAYRGVVELQQNMKPVLAMNAAYGFTPAELPDLPKRKRRLAVIDGGGLGDGTPRGALQLVRSKEN